jgi:tetratricopeptide (TPR) repeat protein
MSKHSTWFVAASCLLSACAGVHNEPRTAHEASTELAEPKQTLTKGQLTEVASMLDRRGDAVRAEQYWMLALEAGAPADTIMPQLIASFVRDRQYRLALQHAEQHLRSHPNAYNLRLLTGALYEAVGNYAAAVEHYQAVADRHSERPEIHYILGAALLKQGISHSEADASFRKYLDLAPHGRYAEQAKSLLLKEAHAALR